VVAASRGIPVPAIFAVRAQAYVLSQAVELARAGAVRLIVGDGGGHFLQRVEALRLLVHAGFDFLHAFGIDLRRHVDQDESSRLDPALADRHQAGAPAHGGADQDRRPAAADGGDDAAQVLDHQVDAIVALTGPAGVAMTARIKGDRVIAG